MKEEHTKKKLCGFLVFTDAWDGALLTIYRGTSTLHGFIAMSLALTLWGKPGARNYWLQLCLREMSNENPEAMQTLLSLFASDAARLAREGLDVGGIHLWFLHVGTKGDLPALGKLGSFKRTFSHCPRAPRSKKACGGICHRCLGGQEESIPHGMEPFPYEDFSSNPGWERTQDQVEPWDHIPKVMTGMPTNPMQRSQFFFFWCLAHVSLGHSEALPSIMPGGGSGIFDAWASRAQICWSQIWLDFPAISSILQGQAFVDVGQGS